MEKTNPLRQVFSRHFDWHQSRIDFLTKFIIALLRVETVNLTHIARGFSGSAKVSSHYKRIKRFLRHFDIDYGHIAKFSAQMFDLEDSWILCLDRTNWKFGKLNINILVLAAAYKGTAIPLLWEFLPKQGISNTEERIQIMNRFLKIFPRERIRCLTADREFIGHEWISYLRKNNIPFRIRIRNNTQIPNSRGNRLLSAKSLFRGLTLNEVMVMSKKRLVWGLKLHVIALKINGDYVFLITDNAPHQALDDYRQRWQIETLFGCLKTRGFNLEDTHLNDIERISRLFALITIAFCWSYKIGEQIHSQKAIPIKAHGRMEKSIFRKGLDCISHTLLNLDDKYTDFIKLINFLSRT